MTKQAGANAPACYYEDGNIATGKNHIFPISASGGTHGFARKFAASQRKFGL